ncbi:hypothetical protein OIO90_000157 [Microbotryomycetes sp. JL221]|nr:hypothetical protein OIO90_000157 [Microbotryomycetes sp. JL221]
MSEDPAATFFPNNEKIDLYNVLKISKDSNDKEIKSAYRRLALLHHPDKVLSSIDSNDIEKVDQVNLKFQQIGFAYTVLSDDKRRQRYDETGRTDQIMSGKTEAEWKDYFEELWQGEVTTESIEKFASTYRESDEERQDLLNAYKTFDGDFETILMNIMCSTTEDEERFIKTINQAIQQKQLKKTKQWFKSTKDLKAKQTRRLKADKEAKEAEEYAKELGVFEKLKKGNDKGKAKSNSNGDDDDEAGLKALIQGNQQKRMNALMESLEAKYGADAKKARGKKRASNGDDDNETTKKRDGNNKKKQKEQEPSEEEFQKIQAQIEARRAKGKK